MDVRSAFNSGIVGFQNASAQVSNASSRIAQAGIAEKSMTEKQLPSEIISPSAERASISMGTELINLTLSETQASSSAKVISSADELLGTLIDTRV